MEHTPETQTVTITADKVDRYDRLAVWNRRSRKPRFVGMRREPHREGERVTLFPSDGLPIKLYATSYVTIAKRADAR